MPRKSKRKPTRRKPVRVSKAVKKLLDEMTDAICKAIVKDIIRDQHVKKMFKPVAKRKRAVLTEAQYAAKLKRQQDAITRHDIDHMSMNDD